MVSIIVTHKKDNFYLKDCLQSIADQSEYRDFETVLVLDHPEEPVDELIAEFLDSTNLRVFELTDKTGAAAARNRGMDEARGEYILFLDNDDYFYKETLSGLMQCMEPDVDMVYCEIRNTWFQRQAYNEAQKEEEENEEEDDDKETGGWFFNRQPVKKYDFENLFDYKVRRCKTMEQIILLGAVYRKALFTENNIRFNEDLTFFVDVPVAASVFGHVKKYRACAECYYIKRRHNDKTNNPALSQHDKEDTMPDYFAVCKMIKETAGAMKGFKDHLDMIVSRFVVKEYVKKVRWSEDERWCGEFYGEFVQIMRDINVKNIKDYEAKLGERAVLKALKSGDYDKFHKKSTELLAIRKVKNMIKSRGTRNKTIALYIFNKMKLKENWIVFESFMGRNCSGQPKYIYKYMQEHYGSKFTYIWVRDKKSIHVKGKHKSCRRFSLRYYYYMNRSKYWVNNMRQSLSIPRREETIMLATWHGTPLKRLVFDMDDVHSANSNYKQVVYRQTREWDYLLSDNPYSTKNFESCFLFDRDKILEYGYPANDPLYDPNISEHARKIKAKLGIPLDKKVILYAPTWRDDTYYERGKYGFELDLDIDRMKREFGDEYVMLLRLHYLVVDQLDIKKYGDFTFNGSEYDDITDLYIISDILITDYSSVFFDYANLRRPVLFYTYDLEKYRDVLRGFYLDMEKDLPGPLLMTNDELVDAIENIDVIEKNYKEKYDKFYDEFCCCDDGNASKRVVEKVFGLD